MGINNLSGYLTLDNFDTGVNMALAARYEFLVSGYEITVGGIYQPQKPWALMTTAAGSIADVSVFAEGVLEGNSDKVFVIKDDTNPLGLSTETREGQVFFSGTVGGRYSYTTEDDMFSVAFSAQYFYNGQGYSDIASLTENPEAIGALLAQGKLRYSDLFERGQHYLAANVFMNDIAKTDLSPSLLWLMNLNDGSGFLNASVRYSGLDPLSLSLGYRFNYGPEGGEYSPLGDKHSLSLSVSLSGTF
ncbi:MAG: hypothetical protein R2880_15440 [Deinococcales bacterium]